MLWRLQMTAWCATGSPGLSAGRAGAAGDEPGRALVHDRVRPARAAAGPAAAAAGGGRGRDALGARPPCRSKGFRETLLLAELLRLLEEVEGEMPSVSSYTALGRVRDC